MLKNPWFTLVLGLLIGVAAGHILAERQAVPPAKAAAGASQTAQVPAGQAQGGTNAGANAARQRLMQQAAELENMLATNPGDYRVLVGLGDLYYDAEQWTLSKMWYERALATGKGDANVYTDFAVVLRNLGEFEGSLKNLRQASAIDPQHWQAVYNTVVVLHFDLHQHDESVVALDRLRELKATNPQMPDISELEADVLKHISES